MFAKEDFDLPLEKQLRLRVINKEVDECGDIDVLKESIKQTTECLMKYQHLLTITLKKQIEQDMTDFVGKMEEEVLRAKDGNTGKE